MLRYQCTPKFDHFSNCFSRFLIDPVFFCSLSFKKFYKKRLILSKVINEKRFFPSIISKLIAVNTLSREGNLHKRSRNKRGVVRLSHVCVLKIGRRRVASSVLLL